MVCQVPSAQGRAPGVGRGNRRGSGRQGENLGAYKLSSRILKLFWVVSEKIGWGDVSFGVLLPVLASPAGSLARV